MAHTKLRSKPITGGRLTLYADTYTPTGERIYKGLGIYLISEPKNKDERRHNRQLLKIAATKCRNIEAELSKPEVYAPHEKKLIIEQKKRQEKAFVLANTYRQQLTGSKYRSFDAAIKLFERFCGDDCRQLKCEDITLLRVQQFRQYLMTTHRLKNKMPLSHNSAATYFAMFKGFLSYLYAGGYMEKNLVVMVEGITPKETNRGHLEKDELLKLMATPTENFLMKQAALFSAFTGLRFSDIVTLEFIQVKTSQSLGWHIDYSQQKTGDDNILPISDNAYKIIIDVWERGGMQKKPFGSLNYHNMQRDFKKWIREGGITGKITFHAFRHTNAMLLLGNGVDIYTISKMLGHKSIKTTEIYTRVLADKKKHAADIMYSLFN